MSDLNTRWHRVYVPLRGDPILQDIYAAQVGKYIVSQPCFPGDFWGYPEEVRTSCKAVMDDFGTLRRVQG